ncbi:propionate--CoA ligase [Herbaspirillum seropedicae]|uniref:Propionate--CoA ligase n=1 Tax=Herbaspirillum seropedicae (strain SmR1) TaxID=757424 RepID=D8J0P5_HERSS|nr:propionate--CoA ligase [Herbaspirillum seropedicae]ADJ64601.1 propionyl-CoA ligase protein [Herbaspirillum seropedicae SmR1]AKN66525.1 propionyl-CoA synthetase [Herbaspirillum seropedicae]NQE28482.1 propionyl-CoA synthetase [Herbaspirillum seropedicae]UMU22516.1 propionate--CoA ligase [Herbaspirillum seropedicae]
MQYEQFYRQSVEQPEAFWAQEAQRIHWQQPFSRTLDYSRPPFARWFIDGQTNLCHNAVDRHLPERAQQAALIAISTETNSERVYTYAELQQEVMAMAASMQALGVQRGDRVLIYMPMIAEAVFAMLACARIGAVHSVVFGGFASNSLASRIDDAQPRLIVSADAGSRGGKVIPYKGLLDEAIAMAQHRPQHVLLVDRGLAPMARTAQRDVDYAPLRTQHLGQQVPVTWLESNASSYILYTSGTTGKPKGVQRDVGGYAVALASSMQHIFCGQPGETYFCTSDIGWVVGHSYIVYGPLIAGMATVLYEGLPIRPDAGIWWSIVEKYKVTRMFSAPTAIRVLKKQPPECMERYDTSSLKALYLAGEPLDETTSSWISGALKVPVIDNYWQTESGWPIISIAKGIDDKPTRLGSPGVPMPGYRLAILDEATGEPCGPDQKGVVAIEGPLPPGCMQTVYGDDERFVNTYWRSLPREVYSTFDWGIRDKDGYYFILGRTDDVINVAGHRLGTREIEESISSHPNVSEVAVVGVEDKLKGQVAFAFAIPKQAYTIATPEQRKALEAEIMAVVDKQIGAVGRPARVFFVSGLPKTRSGKLLRRAIQSICEGRDPGDLPTIEDPAALEQVRAVIKD